MKADQYAVAYGCIYDKDAAGLVLVAYDHLHTCKSSEAGLAYARTLQQEDVTGMVTLLYRTIKITDGSEWRLLYEFDIHTEEWRS